MSKKAFSLFELILVVILIGLVYSLVLSKIENKKSLKIQKLENLKDILLTKKSKQLEMIVYDNCQKILINGEKKEFNNKIFQNIKVYNVKDDRLEEIEFAPLYIKEKIYNVCLKFNIYKNKSSSSFIIKKDNKYIVFYPYFKKSEIFYDENNAIEAIENKKLLEEYNDEK